MKTSRVVLLLLIGLVIGYLIRMVVHPRDKGLVVTPYPVEIPIEVSADSAQMYIDNYVGTSITTEKLYYTRMSDELLNQIIWVRTKYNSDGSIIYFGSEEADSEEADVAIIGRTDGTTLESTFFKVPLSPPGVPTCPKMCDVPLPDGEIVEEEPVRSEEPAPSEEPEPEE